MPTPFSGLFIIGKERLQDNGGCSKRTRDPGHNHTWAQPEDISGSLAHCYNVNAAWCGFDRAAFICFRRPDELTAEEFRKKMRQIPGGICRDDCGSRP